MQSYPNTLPLTNVAPDGKAPRQRLEDANAAYTVIYDLLRQYNTGQGTVNAQIKASIDGNPPFDPAALAEVNQSWRANINFRLLESDIAYASVPYYSLFSEVPYYATITVEDVGNPMELEEWGRIMSEEHYRLMNRWKGFDYQMQLSISQRVKFGWGPLYFPDERDPRFKAARVGEVLVPSFTSCDISELPTAVIIRDFNVTELYNCIEQPKASDAGWEIKNVQEALTTACNISEGLNGINRGWNWEYWQTRIRNNDLYYSVRAPYVKAAHLFIKEFSGKISHYIVSMQNGTGVYLYQNPNRYENWNQILHFFHGEIAEGYLNGVKGIGTKAFNIRDAQNKLKCMSLDSAIVGSQVLTQAKTPEAEEALDVIQLGPYARLPAQVDILTNPIASVLDKPLLITNAMEQDLVRNIGSYRQNLTDTGNSPVSATEANLNYSQNQTVNQQQISLFTGQLDDFYSEQVRRLCLPVMGSPVQEWEKMVDEFQSRCLKRGVIREAFKHINTVKSYRAIGQGSQIFRNQIHEKIISIFPLLPPEVQEKEVRNYLASLGGEAYLNTIWPAADLITPASNDEGDAQLENGLLTQGMSPILVASQNQFDHLKIHLQFLTELFQAVQQGGDPQKFLGIAQTGLPHVQQHLQLAQKQINTPNATQVAAKLHRVEFQTYFNQYQQLQSASQKLLQNLQAQAAAQQQQAQQAQAAVQQQGQQASPETQDMEIKAAQAALDMKIKSDKATQDLAIHGTKARQSLAIKDAEGAAKVKKQIRPSKQLSEDSASPFPPQEAP